MKIENRHLEYIGFVLPLLLALICLVSVTANHHQSFLPIPMPQELVGEYSRDGVTWQPLTQEADISALEGDLYLRGTFLREMGEGWQLNFYRNHIGIEIAINGQTIYRDDILAVPSLEPEMFASMCARMWMGTLVPAIGPEDTVEIYLHNPHAYGNESAYRDFLTTLCSDPVEWSILELNLEPHGEQFRFLGLLFAAISLMLLGASIAAVIMRIPVGGALLKLGLLTLFAGGYVVFDSIDVSYWSDLNVFNTYMCQLCMMLAAFCLCHFVSDAFTGRKRSVAKAAVLLSALLDSVLVSLSFAGVTVIYDTLPYWAAAQFALCLLFMVFCALEVLDKSAKRLVPVSAFVLFATMLLDFFGVGANIVWRAPCAKIVFSVLLVIHIVMAGKGIVKDYRASIRAAKLEKELEDSRIAIMLSQIKPHFLYNVLNTIYHLYRKEPETAQEAVSSFAEYLRCNMLSIEKSEPIPFTEEYRHVQTYLSLEQIRFRGKLDVIYDVEATDFKLPPLTVEPLVENAVKHGVTKKRGGGSVTVSTRRTDEGVLITVADTGVGFDPNTYMEDGKPHVGIRNVRERLQNMVGGSLAITSSENGTVAVVTIPAKEANHTR
ncbi:MAG: histidine kinase [Oscillospiraceae bacterium]|nr:histidine kinase [Oscillospiraceae bacterium]